MILKSSIVSLSYKNIANYSEIPKLTATELKIKGCKHSFSQTYNTLNFDENSHQNFCELIYKLFFTIYLFLSNFLSCQLFLIEQTFYPIALSSILFVIQNYDLFLIVVLLFLPKEVLSTFRILLHPFCPSE